MSHGWITEAILMNMKAMCDVSGEKDEETTNASGYKDQCRLARDAG